jgi:hypothetical protein
MSIKGQPVASLQSLPLDGCACFLNCKHNKMVKPGGVDETKIPKVLSHHSGMSHFRLPDRPRPGVPVAGAPAQKQTIIGTGDHKASFLNGFPPKGEGQARGSGAKE